MTGRISFVILALVVLAGHQPVSSQRAKSFNGFELVDKTGNISKPTDYRERYELLGTYTVLDPKGNQMHVTYASPGTAEYYRKTGKFPDGRRDGEGNIWNGSRQIDDRRRILGFGN